VDVDSPHVTSVPSNYSGETDTQYERIERETEAKARDAEVKAKKAYHDAKKSAKHGGAKAEAKAKHAADSLRENRDNPVVVGNFVVWTAVAAALG
jgi:hypothetical protein